MTSGTFVPTYERFKVALSNIDGAQWRAFERLATVFLADEYSSLRPLAAASGDGGMDAELFRPSDGPGVAIQISLRQDWETKVVQTCKRLSETAPETRVLVFATNQTIGPKVMGVRKKVLTEFGLYLDVRDAEWFLTQRNNSAAVEAEADAFAHLIADPLLTGGSALQRQAQALDDLEAKAAFVYLGLQWEDDTREKGLTKLCFEAIVRAVLRDTTSDERMSRTEIKGHVAALLPAHNLAQRNAQVDGALNRLSKVYIRHWQKPDEFCLTHDERVRLIERLAQMAELDFALRKELRSMLARIAHEQGSDIDEASLDEAVNRTQAVLERVLLDRGEAFAGAVTGGGETAVHFGDVEAVVYKDLTLNPAKGIEPRIVAATVTLVMADPPEQVRKYLRSLADTYTLFAFMRETPDVQSAIVKIFADGEIWLDTTVVLPLFAEDLLDSPSRAHTHMLLAVRESGSRLRVTEGVVEEITSHINRCRNYYRAMSEQRESYGSTPFLLSCYELSGRNLGDFERWLETFCGIIRSGDDIIDYLSEFFGIEMANLQEDAEQADPLLRAMIGEIWHESREQRDRRAVALGATPMDPGTRARLVAHDVENYVGVVMRRINRGERKSAFGYKTWWLTLDGTAFRVHRELVSRLVDKPPASPAISPDFMLHYLAIGPVRARLSRRTEETLPLMLNMSILDAVPKSLLDLADTLRKELVDLPPHVVRRKIRDTLDEARVLLGAQARAGEQGLSEEVKQRLVRQAKER
jgi:hypothetical protein